MKRKRYYCDISVPLGMLRVAFHEVWTHRRFRAPNNTSHMPVYRFNSLCSHTVTASARNAVWQGRTITSRACAYRFSRHKRCRIYGGCQSSITGDDFPDLSANGAHPSDIDVANNAIARD